MKIRRPPSFPARNCCALRSAAVDTDVFSLTVLRSSPSVIMGAGSDQAGEHAEVCIRTVQPSGAK